MKSPWHEALSVDGRPQHTLSAVVDEANRHDMKLVEATLKAMVIERPEPTEENPQNMSMDRRYDYPEIRELMAA